MGKKDVHTSNYFDDNVRFADFVNGSLYKGAQIVKAEELSDVSKEFLYTREKQEQKVIADNAKLWKKGGVVFALYSIENLTYVDYAVVIRCMLTEAMGYHRQWKAHKKRHERGRKHKDGGVRLETEQIISTDEFLSGISKDDVFYPVVPIVVYYGTERIWDAQCTLHDFLGKSLPTELKQYVNNYKINLFDYHNYDSFEQFHTEVQTVFEFLRYYRDKNELKNILEKNEERYRNVDLETGALIRVLTNDKALDTYQEKYKGSVVDMSNAFEDYRLEGKLEGKIETRVNIVRKKINKGITSGEIADFLELDILEVENIIALLEEYPEEDDTAIAVRICDKMAANEVLV